MQTTKEMGSRAKARKIMKGLHPNLKSTEIVHHKDFNPLNNNIDNLQIVSSQKEHLALHKGIRPKKTTKAIQITIPDETYKILEEKANKEKLRIATLVISIIRKAIENDNFKK